ncbi:MAG: FtsX-like permease family protein [Spirochaetes bacterium]|nr:FtsX-like permease family protein [Spirochaetota bacterium]
MEKQFALFKLGIKYLLRYRRRYGFLFAALVFGFAVITFITTTKDGMYDSVYFAAQAHYAGDIVAVGHESGSGMNISHLLQQNEIDAILRAAEVAGINPEHIVKRTLLGFEWSVIHFNGIAVSLRHVVGSDWDSQAFLFDRMAFYGEPVFPASDNSIFVSAPVARHMGLQVGDSLVLEVDTVWGQRNTGVFVVHGLIDNASFFAYHKVYVPRVTLNRLLLLDDNDSSTIGFFLDNPTPANAERNRQLLQNALLQEAEAGNLLLGPLVHNRYELETEINRSWNGIKLMLYTLPVYLSEISELLGAMDAITYFLYAMMLVIIFASAAVTYKLILHERTMEMGIMRAVGFYGGDLRMVLWVEIIVLALISLIVGFLVSLILSGIVSRISFAWFPSFEIFMRDGRLLPLYTAGRLLFNSGLAFAVLVLATLVPSFRVSTKKLTGLLSGEPL